MNVAPLVREENRYSKLPYFPFGALYDGVTRLCLAQEQRDADLGR